MVPHQMLVEMLDREALLALAVKPLDLLGPVRRDPPARRLAEPPVDEAGLAFLLVPRVQRRNVRSLTPSNSAASAWLSSANSQAVKKRQKPRHAHSLLGFPPAHPAPPKRAKLTGQIVRYLNQTYRVLASDIFS